MSDWVHIEPPAPRLTPVQERIREMLRAGKTFREICRTLMIRTDHLRDEIFEIRKYEAIMGKGKNLTKEQKATICAMKDAGESHDKIAQQVGCSPISVGRVLRAAKAKAQYHEKKTAINKEFDDAVNEMIAEAAQESEPEPEPVQIPAAVPDAVIRAVEDKITELQTMIRDNTERIESLKQHNKNFAERVVILESWLKEVQT